jgi:hypothetical protein
MTTPSTDFDRVAVRAYLSHYEGAQGRIGLSSFQPVQEHLQFRTDREGLDAAAEKLAEWDAEKRLGLYLRFFTTVMPGVPGRGEAKDSLSLLALAADVDYGSIGHAETPLPLPPDEESARLIVDEAGLPEPTEWINSGGGLYPVWRFAEHWDLTHDDIPAAQGLSERLHRALQVSAERLGWHYGYTGDLSRVLRIPGTVNRKADTERPCRLVSDDGPYHFVEDLRKSLPPLPAKPVAPRREQDEDEDEASGPFDALRLASPADVLEPAEWTFVKTDHRGELWLRPGDAESAYSLVAFDSGAYVCHSTSTELPPGVGLSAGDVFAYLHHRGDRSEATCDLIAAARGGDASEAALGLPEDVLAAIAAMSNPRATLEFDPGVLEAFNARFEAPIPAPRTPLRSYLLGWGDLDRLPEPEPLIEGVLMRHSLMFLVGRNGAFKSFVAFDWAACIATGSPWQGVEVTPGRVLYVAGEGAHGLRKRRDAWLKERGVDCDDDSLMILPRMPNLIRDHGAVDELCDIVREEKFDLVILDTLARATSGGDENAGKDASVAVEAMDRIKLASRGGSTLAVAHSQKDDKDLRGWSGVEDAADVVWHAKRKAMTVELENRKQKDVEPHPTMSLSLAPLAGSLVVRGQSATPTDTFTGDGTIKDRLFNILVSTHSATGATKGELVTAAKDYGITDNRQSVYRAIDALVKTGRAKREGVRFYPALKETNLDHP